MIPALRQSFNQKFRPEAHQHLLQALDARAQTHIRFRIAETPVFLPASLLENMAAIGAEITHSLLANAEYQQAAINAIPPAARVAGETSHPNFLAADFGLTYDTSGQLQPTLVEIQAFPSLFAFQPVLAEAYRTAHDLHPDLRFFLNKNTEATFSRKLAETILNGHNPQNVVLLEINPQQQKTLPDFHLTAHRLGLRILNITDLVTHPPHLCYREGPRLIPIHRIYNRAIPEELPQLPLPIDLQQSFQVQWTGHPSWYYRISKFSLPYLNHPAVPRAAFLDQYLSGNTNQLPEDATQLVLKPLYAYAGRGIRFHPTREILKAIPPESRHQYLVQQRVHFARVIETPHGLTQPEVRILYLWPDKGHLEPVLSLVRLGRGNKMGADQNQDQPWTGVTVAFYQ